MSDDSVKSEVDTRFSSLTQEKKDLIASLEKRIYDDIYDVDAWLDLLATIRQITPITEDCRQVYERFFEVYPTSAPQWKIYLEHELESLNFDKVEKILSRCLLSCPDVDLWLTYIRYVRISKRGLEDEYLDAERAFEFAIQHVGDDVNAVVIWQDYISFLASVPTQNAYEQQQQRVQIRKVYQRALQIPMARLDLIWKAYDVFEHSVSASLAKTVLSDFAAKYVTTNALAVQRRKVASGIPAFRPPCPISRPEHASHWPAWKAYLEHEQSNPQRIERPLLRKRVLHAYKRASLACCHIPQLWYGYANYVHNTMPPSALIQDHAGGGAGSGGSGGSGGEGEVMESMLVWMEAMKCMPYSVLIRLLYADYLESMKRINTAKEIYESMIVDESTTTNVSSTTTNVSSTTTTGTSPSTSISTTTTTLTPTTTPPPVSTGPSKPLTLTHTPPLVWVHYLFFTRRTEGRDASRKLFLRARKFPANKLFPNEGWQCYVAAATIERYADSSSEFAAKILDVGSKLFPQEEGMSVALLDHLENTGDYANLKSVCERLLHTIEQSCGLYTNTQSGISTAGSGTGLSGNLSEINPEASKVLNKHSTYLLVWDRYLRIHRSLCEPLPKIFALQQRRALILGTSAVVTSLEASDAREKTGQTAQSSGNMPIMGETRALQLLTSLENVSNASGAAVSGLGGTFPMLSMRDNIDRYSFVGLTPCNAASLRSIENDEKRREIKEQKKSSSTSSGMSSGHVRGVLRCASNKQRLQSLISTITQPNISKMTVFTRVLAAQYPFSSPSTSTSTSSSSSFSSGGSSTSAGTGTGMGDDDDTQHISTFMSVDPRERAPPLNITEYMSPNEAPLPVTNHACINLHVSPLMNGLLHMLHNKAGSRASSSSGSGSGEMKEGVTVTDVRNRGAILAASNTPFESNYEGPYFNIDALISHMHTLRLHREKTHLLFDPSRWADVRALFPATVKKVEKRRRDDEEDSDEEAVAHEGEIDAYRMRKMAKAKMY